MHKWEKNKNVNVYSQLQLFLKSKANTCLENFQFKTQFLYSIIYWFMLAYLKKKNLPIIHTISLLTFKFRHLILEHCQVHLSTFGIFIPLIDFSFSNTNIDC